MASRPLPLRHALSLFTLAVAASPAAALPQVTQIIGPDGDGLGNTLVSSTGIAVDSLGNAYVTSQGNTKVFKIAPSGAVTLVADGSGDGAGHSLAQVAGIAMDANDDVYVAGVDSNNVFRIAASGAVELLVDVAGDGAGGELLTPTNIAVDAAGNLYVAGFNSDNVLKRAPDGTITEIVGPAGDGAGNGLDGPVGLATDAQGNVFVSGFNSSNLFRISAGGVVTEILDAIDDGLGNDYANPANLAVDADGVVYSAGRNAVYRITPGGAVSQIIGPAGDGSHSLAFVEGLAVGPDGRVYVAGTVSNNVFEVSASGIQQILDATGDGAGNGLSEATGVAVDGAGAVYVTGYASRNAFRIVPPAPLEPTIYEGFDYTPSSTVAGLAGGTYLSGSWAQAASGGSFFIGPNSLEVGDLATSGGHTQRTTPGGNYGDLRAYDPATFDTLVGNGEFWMSFVFELGPEGNLNVNPFAASFGINQVLRFQLREYDHLLYTHFASGIQAATGAFATNEPTLVVARFTVTGPTQDGENDTMQVWINPTPGTAAPDVPMTLDATFTFEVLPYAGFTYITEAAGSGHHALDEWRMGPSYAAVTPVQSAPPPTPVAVASGPGSVVEGQAFVMLDGSGSTGPAGSALDYFWTQTAGTTVALSDPTAVQPTFTAPLVGLGGEVLSFQLTVTANGVEATDTVDVTVLNLNHTPVVSITAPTDGAVSGSLAISVSAEVTDEDATTISSTPAGLTPGTLAAGGGTVSGSLSLDLEGANEILVDVEDAGGLTAATSIVVYRDTANPSVAISPAEGTVVSTPIPSFGITVTDQTTTEVTIDGGVAGSAEVPEGETYGVATALLTGSIPLWSEGPNTIVVQATDAAGNTTTVTRTVILDSTAPVVEITTPTNGACYGIGSAFEIPLSATVDDATATEVTGDLTGSLDAGGGSVVGTYTLMEGVNSISVSAQDAGGEGLTATDTVSVTLDTIAPTVEITSPADAACVRGTIEVHATTGDALPGAVDSTTYFLDGVALAPAELVLVDTTLLADGDHDLTVEVIDTCGNVTSTSITIQVDNTAPAVALSNPFDLDWVMGTIAFDATATDGGTGLVEISMTAAGGAPSTDGSQEYMTPVSYDAVSSLVDTLAATGGLDGDLELAVTARDCAGNETTVAVTVRVDNTAPEKAIASPADGAEVRCEMRVQANADDPNLASVQFVIDGVASAVLTAPPFEVAFDTRTRLDGDMPITLLATDHAGNVSTCTIHVTVDNLEVELKPETMQLKSRGKSKSVTAKIEGQSADLLVGLDPAQITLCVPGGSPIPATSIFGHSSGWRCECAHESSHRGRRKGHEHGKHGHESQVKAKFDRRLLIGALRGAGQTHGRVEVTLKVTVDGETFVIGSDEIRVKG